jgi:methylglutaconyl-CoA hydratase
MSMMAINATEWYTAEWAKEKGLFAEIFNDVSDMDEAIVVLANQLSKSNPEAMYLLKKAFWEGTENWDTLLADRAAMSGQLVLSDFTKNAINEFKNKR